MSKVSAKKQKKKNVATFPLINLDSAGIDIADKEMVVAVPADRDKEPSGYLAVSPVTFTV